MSHRCIGLTKNLNRCSRRGNWRFLCPEHRKQPLIWLSFLIFTVGAGSISFVSYFSEAANNITIQNNYKLTNDQKATFLKTLSSAEKPREIIKLGCAGTSEKACLFAGQLYDLFREAGWTVQDNKVDRVMLSIPLAGVAIFRRGEGKLDPTNPKSGLWVKQTKSLQIVKESFEKVGIPTTQKAEASFKESVIGVYIGPFPEKSI